MCSLVTASLASSAFESEARVSPVEALRVLFVVERCQEAADLRRGQLRHVPLDCGEGTRARVVDLDQAPSATRDHEWHEQHGLHLHLVEDEQLRRIGARVGGRDRAGAGATPALRPSPGSRRGSSSARARPGVRCGRGRPPRAGARPRVARSGTPPPRVVASVRGSPRAAFAARPARLRSRARGRPGAKAARCGPTSSTGRSAGACCPGRSRLGAHAATSIRVPERFASYIASSATSSSSSGSFASGARRDAEARAQACVPADRCSLRPRS